MSEQLLYAVDAGVVTLTLNRPEVLNALNRDTVFALDAALRRIESDDTVRAVVLRGAGNGFMAGGDIKYFNGLTGLPPDERRRLFERFIGDEAHPVFLRLQRLRAPVIASVHGAVAGVGLSLMLACDLAVASADAFFTLAYVRIGASPDGAATYVLPRHVGRKRAMEITLLGDNFDAPTALNWGLVNRVVPRDELEDTTMALARRLAQGPAAAIMEAKRLITHSLDNTLEEQLDAEAYAFARCSATADFAEGVGAFVAKRPAKFGGGT